MHSYIVNPDSFLSINDPRLLRNSLISPLPANQPLYRVSRQDMMGKKKHKKRTLPWWFIFIAYGLSFFVVIISALFITARGIEFGDLKTRQWLTSSVTGFFSSILFTQPVKVR